MSVSKWSGAVCCAAWFVGSPALATTGLEWKLDEGSVRYLMEAQVHLPELMWVRSQFNTEIRVSRFAVNMITECSRTGDYNKRSWELGCRVEDVSLGAFPVKQDAERILDVLEEWESMLDGSTIQVVFSRDGRVQNVDLEGVSKANERMAAIEEAMRLVLVRAMASMDLQLPKKGDDKGKQWTQKTPLTMTFVSNQGTFGLATVKHRAVGGDDGEVVIESEGKGTLGSGKMVPMPDGSERPKDLYDMSLSGTATFDPERGVLLDRAYVAEGTLTASSISSSGFSGYPYVVAAGLRLLDEGEKPQLPPTRDLSAQDGEATEEAPTDGSSAGDVGAAPEISADEDSSGE